jgi:hypothetical protein
MNVPQRRDRDRRLYDAADELIRRHLRSCESLPLFPDPAPPLRRGFFDPPNTFGSCGRSICRLERSHRPRGDICGHFRGGRQRR